MKVPKSISFDSGIGVFEVPVESLPMFRTWLVFDGGRKVVEATGYMILTHDLKVLVTSSYEMEGSVRADIDDVTQYAQIKYD